MIEKFELGKQMRFSEEWSLTQAEELLRTGRVFSSASDDES